MPAALAAVEEELVSPRALSVLVDALADGPVALADVFLVRVRVSVRVRDGPVALAGVCLRAVLGEVTAQPVAVDLVRVRVRVRLGLGLGLGLGLKVRVRVRVRVRTWVRVRVRLSG